MNSTLCCSPNISDGKMSVSFGSVYERSHFVHGRSVIIYRTRYTPIKLRKKALSWRLQPLIPRGVDQSCCELVDRGPRCVILKSILDYPHVPGLTLNSGACRIFLHDAL